MNFQCQKCGACCRWPGYVRLTFGETEHIAAFLGMDVHDFIDRFTRLTDDRRGLSLIENPDQSCIFLVPDNSCLINPVKPVQCLAFPDKWNFPGFEKLCPGAGIQETAEKG